jgi:hypothetical protein
VACVVAEILDNGQGSTSAWISCVKNISFMLGNISVIMTDEDHILALTMGLNATYDSFIISLDSTPTADLTLNYVVHCMLNEEVQQGNHEVGGASKVKHKSGILRMWLW